jgi:hypothetical protein
MACGIDDFPFAHAAGTRLAEADDAEHTVGVQFADDGADFGSADFQADEDGSGIRHGACGCGKV